MLKLIVGPMKAEKTGELIRLVKRASIGNKNIVVLSPQIDERTVGEVIESRNGSKVKAFRIQTSDLIESFINESVDIVFIDEIHLWDEGLVRAVCKLTDSGIDVICSGLDMNYMSAPFEIVSRLLALADEVEKLTSVCEECGSDKGRRTARYINGKPASFNSPEILVDGTNTSVVYKTFCNKCYRKIGMFGLGGYPMKNIEIPESETAAVNC
ncbi:MAG: thymidine kinase [bacterium]